MKSSRQKALNNFGKGSTGMAVAYRELKLPMYAVKVAGSQGIGTAVEHVRATKAKKKAARLRSKASRRVNR